MPSCKKRKKFTDKDNNVFFLECVDSEGHEGKHQTSIKDVESGYCAYVFYD